MTFMTTHPLLDDLEDYQQDLIRLLGRPWEVQQLSDAKGWPVWDFVERNYRSRRPTMSAADVLASLPTITIRDRPYGLWWRGQSGRNAAIASDERVGLSIIGLHHLNLLIRDQVPEPVNAFEICLDLVRVATEWERELDADNDWTKVATGEYDLRTGKFSSRSDAPVELIGQVLMREFIPIAVSTTNFNYVTRYGGSKLAALRGVRTVQAYVRVAEELASESATLSNPAPSPIALPTALDYLGLVLDQDKRWKVEAPTLRLSSLADATLLSQSPKTQADFDQRVSAFTNILGRLSTPRATPEAYETRAWDPATSGSLNNLEIWLADVAGVGEEVTEPMATLRAVGTIRQAAQHANTKTFKRRDTEFSRFGLVWPIVDWPGAWGAISDRSASAIYAIAQSIRRG